MASSIIIAVVNEELKHIPKGKGIQNRLRMIYSAMRRSHLATNGDRYPASETLRQATELLGSLSGKQAEWDREFFGDQRRV